MANEINLRECFPFSRGVLPRPQKKNPGRANTDRGEGFSFTWSGSKLLFESRIHVIVDRPAVFRTQLLGVLRCHGASIEIADAIDSPLFAMSVHRDELRLLVVHFNARASRIIRLVQITHTMDFQGVVLITAVTNDPNARQTPFK